MGLLIDIYRPFLDGYDCTNGGVSSDAKTLCLINADGPFDGRHGTVVKMVPGNLKGTVKIVPLDGDGNPRPGTMFGGNIGYTSDARFQKLLEEFLGPDIARACTGVSIHDRIETTAESEFYSR